MEYLIIKDGIIKEHCCGTVLPDGAVQVTDFFGTVGEPVAYYNDDWTLKTDIELYREGIVPIPAGFRIENDTLVEMSEVEKIKAGLEAIPAGYKIENNTLVEKTDAEKLADGDITQDEYDTLIQEQYNSRVVELIRAKYSINDEYALINKGIADASDADYVAYRAYVAECKAKAKKEV